MRIPISLVFLLALPVMAQQPFEVGLSYDSQIPKKQTIEQESFEAKSNSGLGIHFTYAPWVFGDSTLGVTAALRLKGNSNLDISIPNEATIGANYKYYYNAIGVQYLWRKPFDFGFGLQYRFEKVSIESLDGQSNAWSGTVARPWLEARVGYTFETSSFRPFIALVAAVPLTSTGKPTTSAASDAMASANQEQLAKSMAPQFDLAFHVGLRF